MVKLDTNLDFGKLYTEATEEVERLRADLDRSYYNRAAATAAKAEVERLRAALVEITKQQDPNVSFKECFCDEIARAALAEEETR